MWLRKPASINAVEGQWMVILSSALGVHIHIHPHTCKTCASLDKHWKQKKGLGNAETLKMKYPLPDHTGDGVSVLSISFPTNAHV